MSTPESMTRHLSDDDLDAALAALDPAPARDRHAAASPQATLLLERILSTPGAAQAAAPATPLRARDLASAGRLRRRGLAVLGAAAALGVGAVLVGPGLFGTGDAMASWTAVPTAASVDDLAAAADACREFLDPGADPLPEQLTSAELAELSPVLAERRGDFMLVVLASSGTIADCLVEDVGGPLGFLGLRYGGGGGGYRDATGEAPVDGLSDAELAGLSTSSSLDGEDAAVQITGRAGADVVAMTVHLPGGLDVDATVEDGYFAAWAPLAEAAPSESASTGSAQSWVAGIMSGPVTATLTLADGRQVESEDLNPQGGLRAGHVGDDDASRGEVETEE